MQSRRGEPGGQIEEGEAEMSEPVFDVVRKHPKEEQVGAEVEEAAMQEHGGDEGGPGGHELQVRRQHGPAGDNGRDQPETVHGAIKAALPADLPEIGCDARDDEQAGDKGQSLRPIEVPDRKQNRLPLQLRLSNFGRIPMRLRQRGRPASTARSGSQGLRVRADMRESSWYSAVP